MTPAKMPIPYVPYSGLYYSFRMENASTLRVSAPQKKKPISVVVNRNLTSVANNNITVLNSLFQRAVAFFFFFCNS